MDACASFAPLGVRSGTPPLLGLVTSAPYPRCQPFAGGDAKRAAASVGIDNVRRIRRVELPRARIPVERRSAIRARPRVHREAHPGGERSDVLEGAPLIARLFLAFGCVRERLPAPETQKRGAPEILETPRI